MGMARTFRAISLRQETSCSSAVSGHMGIYIGNNQFVHAPHTGDVVTHLEHGWALGLVRRREAALASELVAGAALDTRICVERLDLVREVLLHCAPPQLQRRRDLTLLHREVARKHGEALDLLEA